MSGGYYGQFCRERERESVAIAKSDGHVVIKFCGVGILELTMPSFEWFNF